MVFCKKDLNQTRTVQQDMNSDTHAVLHEKDALLQDSGRRHDCENTGTSYSRERIC